MSLFFLHQRRASRFIPDLEGAEFVNLEAARQEAIQAARELVQEMAHTGVIDLRIVFEIEGSDGQRAVVPFSEAVEVLSLSSGLDPSFNHSTPSEMS